MSKMLNKITSIEDYNEEYQGPKNNKTIWGVSKEI
jgi:hypothetical protein